MKINILGVKIDRIDFKGAIKKIAQFIDSEKSHQIVTVNSEFIIEAQDNKNFKKILNSADLAVADGVGILWASKFLYGAKKKLKERVAGVDLMWEIAKLASENGWRIFLLGGKNGVVRKTSQRLKLLYPDLKIVGASEGEPKYPRDEIVKAIHKSEAQILFVAYGAPKQDIFISENLDKLGVKVAIGVGGSFDFISGKKKRAPKWMQKISLEWLWRLGHEPKRFKRIYNAVMKFPIIIIAYKITQKSKK